jgi:L-ascorbate metabolism protein UlaG (beta-lactamase superfamily)
VDGARLTYVGHATVLIELDGIRLLTDPVLRSRVGPLRRHGRRPDPGASADLDAVLISHLHHDHADLPSLRRVGRNRALVVPPGAGRFFASHGFSAASELAPGAERRFGDVVVGAVAADHDGSGLGSRDAESIGFVVAGSRRVYFAGDTDLFDGMEELGPIDVALLPIWGWGPSLGPGHLDPERAARAAAMIAPRVVVPIHWGTLYPFGLARLRPGPLRAPGAAFAGWMAELAPAVEVRTLQPGQATPIPGYP